MSLSKAELRNQLKKLGVKVEGNNIRKRTVKADGKQPSVFYKADRFASLNVKKPIIQQRKFWKKPEDWFNTEEEATSRFLEVQSIAKKRAVEIEKDLDSLKKRLGFDIGYTMEGDTYGIHEDYLYISIQVDGYEFIQKIEQD